jgi:hypothetical protein
MMKAQLAPDPPQVHPIHIHLQGLLADFLRISSGFGIGCVFTLAVHTQIPLST